MCRPHWFNHPHQIAHSSSQGFLVHSSPGERGGSETRDTGRVADSPVGRAPDKSFSGPSFESLSGQSLFLPSWYVYKFLLQILFHDLSKYMHMTIFLCRTYYLLEQWTELSRDGTSGIPRPPSVTWGVIPWLSGESRSHFQKIKSCFNNFTTIDSYLLINVRSKYPCEIVKNTFHEF